jgi:hypothetical protein
MTREKGDCKNMSVSNKKALPIFHEHESDPDIPEDYGIDENHDGGFYPYIIVEDHDWTEICYLPDERTGFDKRFTCYAAALEYIQERSVKEW